MSNNTLEAGIPVLTEIIPAPGIADDDIADVADVADMPATLSAPLVVELVEPADPVQRSTEIRDEAEWERLERQVRERVLGQVLDRIDVILEQRVRDSLADVLQVAVARLANDIRDGLHHSIKDAVARAVTQEIADLQASKK